MGGAQEPCEIEQGLYIGGLASLDSIERLGIKHVVTVVNQPEALHHPALAGCQRHLVDVEDSEAADLLRRLPAAVAFIATARAAASAVLVHCAAGASRSAAVAAAALMAAQGLGAAAALAAVRAAHPAAAPNAGFVSQLELWADMGCTLRDSHLPYKRYLLAQAARQYEQSGTLDAAALARPQEPGAAAAGGEPTPPPPAVYRCRKCRGLVATTHNVVETEEGPGAAGFAWHKRDKAQRGGGGGGGASERGEGSLFVEPLAWMADILGGPLHLSRLDTEEPRPAAGLAAVHAPRLLAGGPPAVDALAGQLAASGLADGQPPQQQAQQAGREQPPPEQQAQQAGREQRRDGQGGQGGQGQQHQEDGEQQQQQQQQQQEDGRHQGGCHYFTHLILDCDGVLVTGFDIPHAFPDDFAPVFGMDVPTAVAYYARCFGKEEEWGDLPAVAAQASVSAAKEPLYQELTAAGIAPFPGAAALVAAARRAGAGVAVASSGSPDKIAHNLGSAGLAPLFDPRLVVSAQHVARGKPAPDVYLEALRRLDCADASRALVVEDAVNGLKAARAAGCFTAAVTTSLPAAALAPHADLVVGRLPELLPALRARSRGEAVTAVVAGMRAGGGGGGTEEEER
eukprot:scaffold17.g566.t1